MGYCDHPSQRLLNFDTSPIFVFLMLVVLIDWIALDKILGIRLNTLKSGIFRNLVTVWLVSSAQLLPSLRPNSSPRHDLHHCCCVDIIISRRHVVNVKLCKIFHSRQSDVMWSRSSHRKKQRKPTVRQKSPSLLSSLSSRPPRRPPLLLLFLLVFMHFLFCCRKMFVYCLKMVDSMRLSFFPQRRKSVACLGRIYKPLRYKSPRLESYLMRNVKTVTERLVWLRSMCEMVGCQLLLMRTRGLKWGSDSHRQREIEL